MKKTLTVPAAQDIVRIIGPTDLETEQNLLSYYTDPSGGFFSYRAAHGLSRFAFSHTLPLAQILAGCEGMRNKQGVVCNSEVLSLIWELAKKRSVISSYELPIKRLPLRRDLSVKVAPPFAFVEHDKASVFWLQPRKWHALSVGEMAFLASILKATYLVDDYEGVGFEICDLSAIASLSGKRVPRTYTLDDFDLLPEAEVQERLQRFARAFDALSARGVEQKKRPGKRPDTGPDLLDGGPQ